LLRSGVAAGVLVPVVLWIDGATRPGYSLWHHGASQLGTGDRAWLQTLNFLIGGVLLGLFAVGLRRALHPGSGATWGPALIGAAAVGMAVAAVAPTDPALGYPPGRPEGVTAAGGVHQAAGLALFAGLSAAALVLARRMGQIGAAWKRYLRISGVAVIVFACAAGFAYRLDTLDVWRPAPAGLLEHLSLLTGFGWTVAVGLTLSRRIATGHAIPDLPSAAPSSGHRDRE
jgi:hypothetical protein